MDTEPTATSIAAPLHRNVVILAVQIFLVLFIADSLYALLIAILVWGYIPTEWVLVYTVMLWVTHTLKDFLLVYIILKIVLEWIGTIYYISENHLIRRRGAINIKEHIFQLKDIESVSMHQSWLGRMFNFGDVFITFLVAREKQFVELNGISDPEKYEHIFSQFV